MDETHYHVGSTSFHVLDAYRCNYSTETHTYNSYKDHFLGHTIKVHIATNVINKLISKSQVLHERFNDATCTVNTNMYNYCNIPQL